jgi:hypothetical protein
VAKAIKDRFMRGVSRFLLALLLVLVVVWIGGWWYVQSRMVLGFRHAEASARAAGWQISHGAISRGSSPLAARLSIVNLKLVPPQNASGAAQPALILPQAGAHINVGDPFTLHLDLPLQSMLALRDGPSFSVNFTSIDAAYRINRNAVFNPKRNPFRGGSFAASGFRLDSANTNFTLVSIATLTGSTAVHHSAGKGATAFSLREQLGGLALSPIFVTLAHLPFGGRINALTISLDLSGPVPPDLDAVAYQMREAIRTSGPRDSQAVLQAAAPAVKAAARSWAQGGGHGSFALGLGLGPATAHAAGLFSFNENLQPQGDADVTADQLGEFLADIASAYPALIGQISAITSALQPYLIKAPNGAQQLKVHLTDRNQTLTANGNKVVDVPKLDWNKPAAPAP